MKTVLLICVAMVFVAGTLAAHRSGCHRWHSCPSDSNTYICGDTGHCDSCPDNQYCQDQTVISEGSSGSLATSRSRATASTGSTYERSDYLSSWLDADRDCINTRHEVLQAESLSPAVLSANGCTVIRGNWRDPYTGKIFTNPSDLDIDHLVPLAEAHRSGAAGWERRRKQQYANDLNNANSLIAVSASANRSKGDKDPARWLPQNSAYHCNYVKNWVAVKTTWGLAADSAELSAIAAIQARCSDS